MLNVGDSIYHLYFYNPFTREDIKLHTELCDTDYACIIAIESREKNFTIYDIVIWTYWNMVLYFFAFDTILLNQTPGPLLEWT